jgi:hypothetical protein
MKIFLFSPMNPYILGFQSFYNNGKKKDIFYQIEKKKNYKYIIFLINLFFFFKF